MTFTQCARYWSMLCSAAKVLYRKLPRSVIMYELHLRFVLGIEQILAFECGGRHWSSGWSSPNSNCCLLTTASDTSTLLAHWLLCPQEVCVPLWPRLLSWLLVYWSMLHSFSWPVFQDAMEEAWMPNSLSSSWPALLTVMQEPRAGLLQSGMSLLLLSFTPMKRQTPPVCLQVYRCALQLCCLHIPECVLWRTV